MSAKLTRIAMMSIMLGLAWPVHAAMGASTTADQKLLEWREKNPANGFVVMEAKLIQSGKTTEEFCKSIEVVLKSDDGKAVNLLTQELYYFDKANNKFGAGASLPPGSYTVTEITCEKHHYRGNLARFTVQPKQSINLGRLIVEYKSSAFNPFAYPTY